MTKLWIDVETTGLNKWNCAIIEVAAIPIVDYEEHSPFVSLVKPHGGANIEPGAERIHKIPKRKLDMAPSSEQVLDDFVKYLYNLDRIFTISGHNVQFDRDFLYHWFCRYGRHSDFVTLFRSNLNCTWEKAKERDLKEKTKKLNLGTLCGYFGIKLDQAHRALCDIRATIQLNDALEEIKPQKQYFMKSIEGLSNLEKRRKLIDSSYIQINPEGDVFISDMATKNPELFRFVLSELWEVFGEV